MLQLPDINLLEPNLPVIFSHYFGITGAARGVRILVLVVLVELRLGWAVHVLHFDASIKLVARIVRRARIIIVIRLVA